MKNEFKSRLTKVLQVIESELSAANFRLKGTELTKQINVQTIGYVAFGSRVSDTNSLVINPTVGICNLPLERKIAEFRDVSFRLGECSSAARSLGYLTPAGRFLGLEVSTHELPIDAIHQLAKLIAVYGGGFFSRLDTLDKLIAELQKGEVGVRDQNAYRISTGLFLLGRVSESEDFVSRTLGEYVGRADAAADDFRAFAKRIRRVLVH